MDDILPEHTAGPGKLKVFQVLIVAIVYSLVIGALLSTFYNIHIVEDVAMAAANHPFVVLEIAGLIAMLSFAVKAIRYAENQGLA